MHGVKGKMSFPAGSHGALDGSLRNIHFTRKCSVKTPPCIEVLDSENLGSGGFPVTDAASKDVQ
jgi:hypothetical protein